MVLDLIAHANGADMLCLPEVTNCVSLDRKHQVKVLEPGDNNSFVNALCGAAKERGIWIALGSIAVKTDDPDGRFANRSYLIDDQGQIRATYDKIHMFDVQLSETESYHESKGYRPGGSAVLAQTPWAKLGLSICYDLRFPQLYRALAQNGAKVLMVPSAFAVPTGQAHWHSLLRARAIENGCYVVAVAQMGTHPGSGRKTYGHSLVVDPWGQVILDAGDDMGLHFTTLDMSQVDKARTRVASLSHDRPFDVVNGTDNDGYA